MNDLTPYINPTKNAIDEFCNYAYGFDAKGTTINSYDLGGECDRASWYKNKGHGNKVFDARMFRYFQSNKEIKRRVISFLDACDIKVWDQSKKISFSNFKATTIIDGLCLGVKEARTKNHLLFIRPMQEKAFNDIAKSGLSRKDMIKANVDMRLLGLDRCLFIAVNRNNEELHVERLKSNNQFADAQILKADRITSLETPPARIGSGKPSWFQCKMCEHKDHCFEEIKPLEEVIPPNENIWK